MSDPASDNSRPLASAPASKPFVDGILSKNFVVKLSNSLSENSIPNVLWGNFVLAIHGVPTIVDGVAFIVDDQNIAKASTLLSSGGLTECTEKTCIRRTTRTRPSPFFHAHLIKDQVVSLVRKSETLWRLSSTSEDSTKGNIIPAHSPSLPPAATEAGIGPLPESNPPVYIPSVAFLADGLIRLVALHFSDDEDAPSLPWTYYLVMVTYINGYLLPRGLLDEKALHPEIQEFLKNIQDGDGNLRVLIANLKRSIGAPPDVPLLRNND